jgi:hypothetical protein
VTPRDPSAATISKIEQKESAAILAAAAIIKPQVDRIELEITVLADLVKCHERDLYGEHNLPGIAQDVDEMRKILPTVKIWIKVLSILAGIMGATVIAFIWAIITHAVQIVH